MLACRSLKSANLRARLSADSGQKNNLRKDWNSVHHWPVETLSIEVTGRDDLSEDKSDARGAELTDANR